MIRTLAAAGKWIDRVGLALLFPRADIVLPSLWEQVSGLQEVDWNAEPINFLWWAKDALPDEGRACVGKHLGRVASCVAPRLVPVLVAANGDPAEDGDPVVDAIRNHGPLTGPQLRDVTGLAKKDVDRSIASLHHRLVLTNAHLVDEGSTWGSLAHDLLARKWKVPKRLPARETARRELALLVIERTGELTAADLAGVFAWRRKEAAAMLENIGTGRDDEAGFRIWTRR
ncbi:MAG: AlkZ-related protein [Gaiellaceae bacterium]